MNAILSLAWALISTYYFFDGNTLFGIGYMVLSLLAEACHRLAQIKEAA